MEILSEEIGFSSYRSFHNMIIDGKVHVLSKIDSSDLNSFWHSYRLHESTKILMVGDFFVLYEQRAKLKLKTITLS